MTRKERTPKYPERVAEIVAGNGGDLGAMWRDLTAVVRRIETLAHKQLRGADFNEVESRFIRRSGSSLASAMFYAGNSWLSPRDDAPRAAVVAGNPQASEYLHVGIARPRVLYVLYPWKDELILCKGAVLPYYEFAHGSRLDDAGWVKLLDSAKRPAVPEWLAPIVDEGKLAPPKRR